MSSTLIFMMGLPGSGKSLISDIICKYFDSYLVRPEDLYPGNFNLLSEDEQQAIKLASWSTSVEEVKSNIANSHIILDACNANFDVVNDLAKLAKVFNKQTIVIFTKATEDECITRLKKCNKLVNTNLFSKYYGKFAEILTKTKFDSVFVLNTGNKEDIKLKINKIIKKLKNVQN